MNELPPSVLAALGLLAAGCTGQPCLKVAADSGEADTDADADADTDADTDTDQPYSVGPCLETATTPSESAHSGAAETADTGAAETADTGSALFERLSATGVLPADVVERLRRRAQ